MPHPKVRVVRFRGGARRGAALLEAIVALTILSMAGLSVVRLATESGRTLVHLRDTEREIRRASALLDAVALWPRADLDRHLGDRRQGPWRMQVQRVTETLYVVVITDSTEQREILRTALYRRIPVEDTHASP